MLVLWVLWTRKSLELIHHLSYPEGESVNDSIGNDFCTVQYSTIQNAIQVIKQLGRHSQLAKADIEAAYRIVPLHPSNFHFLGFIWKEKYYYDRCLPMGLSESCKLFERTSSALEWIAVNKLGASGVVHVLDDFLFVERTVNNCTRTLQRFECLCKAVGIPLASEKTCGPFTNIQFLGITPDSDLMEARLPADKLSKCWDLLDRYSNKKKISLRDLQSMIGTLQFAISVVLPGRTFLRRLIDLTIGIRRRFYMIRLNSGARSDIAIWKNFLENYNGWTFFLHDVWLTSDCLSLYTDSSSTLGYGAIFDRKWFYGAWIPKAKDFHINILELYPIVASVIVWGQLMANHRILLYTDNYVLVHVLNKQTSPNGQLMHMVRVFVLHCLKYKILFRANHIPSLYNASADHLSRLQVKHFKNLRPESEESPTSLPKEASQQSLLLI
ncbi:hypothetical protein SNE40_018448 [Patella caerulea]|uniref:Reverse transcriptase domain-containing protein n=1 Tax=Patella caerulea TaxID=87958 RepID=A0AAN8J5M3_PATCE